MKTLYLECNMGAAGDMLLAALLELDPDRAGALAALNGLGIPGVRYRAVESVKCGILGTHIEVTVGGEEELSNDVSFLHDHGHVHIHKHHEHEHHEHAHDHSHEHGHGHDHEHQHHEHPHTHEHSGHAHDHHHTGMAEIEAMTAALCCSQRVKDQILAVYHLIAEAESKAHGRPVDAIHFHEVGSLDALADVAGFCLMIERLAPDRIISSPVTTGYGQIRCAHGILPVPAPATAFLLRGIPSRAGRIEGELCTPTGAALLRQFATAFIPMPMMAVEQTGYGMGNKEFDAANCVRAMLGVTEEQQQEISELCCNLDDMTGEAIGYAMTTLLQEGALDVFCTPIQMKKSRPGVLLTCLCRQQESSRFTALLLRHTSTLGVRESVCRRTVLSRSSKTVLTEYGEITVKLSEGFDVLRIKPEYDEVAAAAAAANVPFETVFRAALAACKKH